MALIVEDGTGVADADSYVEIADVTAYLTAFAPSADATLWASAAQTDQERACRLATQYLDGVYGLRWLGRRIVDTMTLDWPRVGVWDRDGFTADEDAVPKQIKDGTCELALRVIKGDTLLADQDDPSAVASESVSVGSISVSTSYFAARALVKKYTVVERLVAELIGSSNQLYAG